MNNARLPAIGITCYPSAGGSGVIATELGLNLARSGYTVHFISSSIPLRLQRYQQNVFYHQVDVANYPVFAHPPYTLSLASAMSEVAERYALDILHVHYAIPHAASAFLAQQMVGPQRLKVITTLHGTDITLVGQEPTFFPITRFLIERSDAVTAVSEFLKRETERVFGTTRPIDVIPNFVDTRHYRPDACRERRSWFATPDQKVILHASNFRKVKNVPAVVEVFARVQQEIPGKLVLAGDGPELPAVRDRVDALGLSETVDFVGHIDDLAELLPCADLVLLPSWHESFGLIALEAMSCGVVVIATDRGGTDEFIDDGTNGFLRDPEDVNGMADTAIRILQDDTLRKQMAEEARRDAVERFGARCVLKQYVALYDRVVGQGG